MGYRTLFIRDSDKLRLYLDNIIVETSNNELSFLISDLKCLVLDNYKTTLSIQLINKLTDNNVAVVICDMSHLPCSQILPLNGYYATGGMILEQVKWSNDMKALLHREIVKEKIQSQIWILTKNKKTPSVIERLTHFKNEVSYDDLTNREGLAAKMYFRELFGKDFVRFESDIINAGLNYGYAVFRSLISSVIVSKGLTPSLGIFHKGKTNSFNLSDDIIELYRPIVDDWVYNNLINKELLLKEDREQLISLLDLKILFDNQLYTVNKTVEYYIDSIIKCFKEGDVTLFKAPTIRNEHDI